MIVNVGQILDRRWRIGSWEIDAPKMKANGKRKYEMEVEVLPTNTYLGTQVCTLCGTVLLHELHWSENQLNSKVHVQESYQGNSTWRLLRLNMRLIRYITVVTRYFSTDSTYSHIKRCEMDAPSPILAPGCSCRIRTQLGNIVMQPGGDLI